MKKENHYYGVAVARQLHERVEERRARLKEVGVGALTTVGLVEEALSLWLEHIDVVIKKLEE